MEAHVISRFAAVFLSFGLFAGCRSSHVGAEQSSGERESRESIKEVTIAEVTDLVRTRSATLVDANGQGTRQEYGVVPGAVLLSNYKNFALSELPSEKTKKLVFYCGGTMCRASDAAASRAAQAGYTDVGVLRDGIKGWRQAGQPTETPRS
jgi:rhodanese-related sulfurtransferase